MWGLVCSLPVVQLQHTGQAQGGKGCRALREGMTQGAVEVEVGRLASGRAGKGQPSSRPVFRVQIIAPVVVELRVRCLAWPKGGKGNGRRDCAAARLMSTKQHEAALEQSLLARLCGVGSLALDETCGGHGREKTVLVKRPCRCCSAWLAHAPKFGHGWYTGAFHACLCAAPLSQPAFAICCATPRTHAPPNPLLPAHSLQ